MLLAFTFTGTSCFTSSLVTVCDPWLDCVTAFTLQASSFKPEVEKTIHHLPDDQNVMFGYLTLKDARRQ